MPKGDKGRKRYIAPKEDRKLLEADDDHNYGVVTKKLGNGRFMVRLNLQNKEVMARVCGKFRHGASKKNNWVEVGAVVLVGLRDFQDNTVDIVHVYTAEETRKLRKTGMLIDDVPEETVAEQEPEEETFNFEDI